MKVVLCWCCEYFRGRYDNPENRGELTGGICIFKIRECPPYDEVCEDFLLRQGLFTNRKIPERCKNYQGLQIKYPDKYEKLL